MVADSFLRILVVFCQMIREIFFPPMMYVCQNPKREAMTVNLYALTDILKIC